MKLKVFMVRDSATNQFGTPMFLVTEGQAIRGFSDECNRAADDNQLYRHPEDFALFRAGVFDTETGVFTTEVPTQVLTATAVRLVKE